MTSDNIFGGDLLLETGTNEIQLVEFILRGESFGVNVDKIQQIIERPDITQIPQENPMISGVFDFRKEVIPLIDLRRCLVFEEDLKYKKSFDPKIIVMDFNGIVNGFLVDDVIRLHRLSWEQIESPNIVMEDGFELYAVGIIKFNDRICIMVDFEKIISNLNSELSIKHTPIITYKEERSTKKILFAEDSQFVRKEVYTLLSTAGYQVMSVKNGLEAYRILMDAVAKIGHDKTTGIENYFNLVITDIEMPQMDGRHLTKQIKEHPLLKKLPVFLFTSMSGMWSQMKAKTIGADGLISKPDIHKVVDKLDRMVL